ncbi:hypothetical protein DYB25_004821 [Aphanomyces astaci]|uniref:Uncharacterized protein n=2 Tax=Aphanomyces astaci TaxID=112090 RepID=A0A397B4L1_APHAT|nr:hypothetical protein DYB25_004821 [Aphanomyces astaci]
MQQSTWTTDNKAIRGLSLDIPGRVVILHNPLQNATAKIDVFTDIPEFLQFVQSSLLTRADGSPYIRTTFRRDLIPQRQYHLHGSVLVHVTLQAPVSFVESSSRGDTILHQEAVSLGLNESLAVEASESNSVYLELNQTVELANLHLTTKDSGAIQLVTSGGINVASSLDVKASDGGVVAVQGELAVTSDRLKVTAADTGAIYVTSTTDQIVTVRQVASVTDKGNVNLYPRGVCNTSKIRVTEFSHANVGSIACQSVSVEASEGGAAVVQAVASLTANAVEGGRVQYFNSTAGLGLQFKSSNVWPVDQNEFTKFAFRPVPSQDALTIDFAGFGWGARFQPPNVVSYLAVPSTDATMGFAVMCVVLFLACVFCRPPKSKEKEPLASSSYPQYQYCDYQYEPWRHS